MRKEVEPGGKNNLRSISLLEDLDKATIERLEKISGWYWYPDGELIFDRTDTGSEVYLIVEGSVRVVGHAKSGQEVAVIEVLEEADAPQVVFARDAPFHPCMSPHARR